MPVIVPIWDHYFGPFIIILEYLSTECKAQSQTFLYSLATHCAMTSPLTPTWSGPNLEKMHCKLQMRINEAGATC